jgi:hypothetical protein
MHLPIARQGLGKQARKKYATNNSVDSLLGNARNNRTGVAGGVFYGLTEALYILCIYTFM